MWLGPKEIIVSEGALMKIRYYTLWLLLLIACFAVATNRLGASPSSSIKPTMKLAYPSPTPQETVPAIFNVTPKDARKAFDEYEARGEKGQQVGIGEKQTLTVVAQGSHGPENLKLTILFLPPLAQARQKGYEFGLVAKQRTPADRKDFEDTALKMIIQESNNVAFRVWLDQPKDSSATAPTLSFHLLDKVGQRINPTDEPTAFVFSGKDLLGDMAIAQDGLPLIFPLRNGAAPNLTSKMNMMTVVLGMDGAERNLEFHLK